MWSTISEYPPGPRSRRINGDGCLMLDTEGWKAPPGHGSADAESGCRVVWDALEALITHAGGIREPRPRRGEASSSVDGSEAPGHGQDLNARGTSLFLTHMTRQVNTPLPCLQDCSLGTVIEQVGRRGDGRRAGATDVSQGAGRYSQWLENRLVNR